MVVPEYFKQIRKKVKVITRRLVDTNEYRIKSIDEIRFLYKFFHEFIAIRDTLAEITQTKWGYTISFELDKLSAILWNYNEKIEALMDHEMRHPYVFAKRAKFIKVPPVIMTNLKEQIFDPKYYHMISSGIVNYSMDILVFKLTPSKILNTYIDSVATQAILFDSYLAIGIDKLKKKVDEFLSGKIVKLETIMSYISMFQMAPLYLASKYKRCTNHKFVDKYISGWIGDQYDRDKYVQSITNMYQSIWDNDYVPDDYTIFISDINKKIAHLKSIASSGEIVIQQS